MPKVDIKPIADSTAQKQKIQFEATKEAVGEIDRLRVKARFVTRADLIRHALRFFQWALEETVDHHAKLLLEKNGGLREIVFPFWGPLTPDEQTVETGSEAEANEGESEAESKAAEVKEAECEVAEAQRPDEVNSLPSKTMGARAGH